MTLVASGCMQASKQRGSLSLLSARELARPAHILDSMIATLFGRSSNVAMLAIAAILCGWLAFERNGYWVSIAISALEVAVVVARCGLIRAYQRAAAKGVIQKPTLWLNRFGGLALASSSFWGALCFVAFASTHDPVLYTIPVLSTVGIAGSVAARNSGVRRLAKAQLVLSLSPILAGCLLADDHGFRVLLLLVPAMAAGLFVLIDERNTQLVSLMETQHELNRISKTDALTEVANRRSFDETLQHRIDRDDAFALLMLDVDHFKSYNDRHGHPAGDLLLKRIAAVLKAELRNPDDFVARYGGEEFAILLQGVDPAGFAAVADRMLGSVSRTCSSTTLGGAVTISIGVARREAKDTPDILLQRADRALYRAKTEGRNRVILPQDDRLGEKAAGRCPTARSSGTDQPAFKLAGMPRSDQ